MSEEEKKSKIVLRESRTEEERVKAYEKLCDKIEDEIEGVEEAKIDDYGQNGQRRQISVKIKSEKTEYFDNGRPKTAYKITQNLKSIRKKIDYLLKEVHDDLVNTGSVYIKPKKRTKHKPIYDTPYYFIEVYSW
ncbi:MAG: hypothetical protein ACOCP8_07620 [archaeon]